MKKLFTLLFAIASATAYAEPTEVAPSVKTPTSFAVFIDRASYDRCREAVEAYRAAVQADGLGTYIICDDWQSPDEVRERILALASDKRMPLEGVVFVGDVPIAMLRDAQHLSSAFKMNQAADRKKSSIPSDRFYDDFDLKFDFIDRDADNPLYFYYSLRHDSAHHIRSDIYSARIKPVVREGVDKYEALSAYLRKAAAEAETVWLASDEDREGEAIAWHLYEVLELKPENTRRIVFHEITKKAILNAIANPRDIDINRVDAQQARRVLDRIVGFELSPVLWKRLKPALSAGRVQSVAVRLIVERENEIKHFVSEPYYRVRGTFRPAGVKGTLPALPRRSPRLSGRLRRRKLHHRRRRRQTTEKIPRAAFHNFNSPAGSFAKAWFHSVTDHDGGAAPLRKRSHHLHAYRLAEPLRRSHCRNIR